MFCGNCGTKLKDGKCPKCDKKETKKTVKTEKVKAEKVKEVKTEPVKEEKANFGWGVLGFFIPVVGLVLFLVFMNKKKSLAKTAGIGALIGVIKNVIVIILYYLIMFVGLFSIVNLVGNPQSPIYDPEPWNDLWEDEDDDDYEGYIETINVSDIDITEELSERDFYPRQFPEFENKEYKFEKNGLSVIRNGNQVSIKDTDLNKVIFEYNNVKKAYYHEFDCSGLDTILIVTNDKTYYINVNEHVKANIKAVELNGKYDGFYYTNNQAFTCGGAIIALGNAGGTYYDLNGEAIINFDNLYYYDDTNNWIGTNRNSKLAGGFGSVKAVVLSSATTSMNGFIDSYGYAYSYVYDYSSRENNVKIEKINNSPVSKIEYNYSKDTVTFVFENEETYTFEFAELNY